MTGVTANVEVCGYLLHVSGRWDGESLHDWRIRLSEGAPQDVSAILAPEIETDIVRAAEEKIRGGES